MTAANLGAAPPRQAELRWRNEEILDGRHEPDAQATGPAVWVRGLRKSYGPVEAVRGIDLEIQRGQIVALLGPNGAGKTTTMEIIEGLRHPDSGEIRVLGEAPEKARRRVGVQLQEGALYSDLTCAESITLFGRLYGWEADPQALLALVDLSELADRRAERLSGGQKRRLQLALTLCNEPELVILDEPTTGLDPLSRRQTWAMIEGLHRQGRTVLLTTHYIEEAEQLAERVYIIDGGKVVAEGAPSALIADLGAAATISIAAPEDAGLAEVPGVLRAEYAQGRWEIQGKEVGVILAALNQRLGEGALRDVSVRPPSLEDVFLACTGRHIETEAQQ
ncbi:MAG TPA: ABC transporter ATP-binding protein [Candidatus Dormibacteraeota bacterium]|nr:ABC transporter ATP-binding protein [Candidatus Dormibacteraeota bacterium]